MGEEYPKMLYRVRELNRRALLELLQLLQVRTVSNRDEELSARSDEYDDLADTLRKVAERDG